ncbi:hypothetical protein E4T56_gene560 [Termitomyces sp. T112]|nr:hypothetical protein E4T56_gene560 [Termitomyces sp. T112]
MVGLNQWFTFINEGIKVVLEEMRSGFVLAEKTRFTEMENMLWQYNTTLQALNECMNIIDTSVVGIISDLDRTKQTVKAHAECLMQNKLQISSPPIQPAPSTSSLPPAPASTLAPIAEAKEPNNDKAAQPKEDESEMDCSTTVAIAVDQSAIADDSALISNPIAIMTNSSISSRPTAIITDSAIATGLAASNESTVPTGVETIFASPIAATGHLIDVDITGPAPHHAPDEIML